MAAIQTAAPTGPRRTTAAPTCSTSLTLCSTTPRLAPAFSRSCSGGRWRRAGEGWEGMNACKRAVWCRPLLALAPCCVTPTFTHITYLEDEHILGLVEDVEQGLPLLLQAHALALGPAAVWRGRGGCAFGCGFGWRRGGSVHVGGGGGRPYSDSITQCKHDGRCGSRPRPLEGEARFLGLAHFEWSPLDRCPMCATATHMIAGPAVMHGSQPEHHKHHYRRLKRVWPLKLHLLHGFSGLVCLMCSHRSFSLGLQYTFCPGIEGTSDGLHGT